MVRKREPKIEPKTEREDMDGGGRMAGRLDRAYSCNGDFSSLTE